MGALTVNETPLFAVEKLSTKPVPVKPAWSVAVPTPVRVARSASYWLPVGVVNVRSM